MPLTRSPGCKLMELAKASNLPLTSTSMTLAIMTMKSYSWILVNWMSTTCTLQLMMWCHFEATRWTPLSILWPRTVGIVSVLSHRRHGTSYQNKKRWGFLMMPWQGPPSQQMIPGSNLPTVTSRRNQVPQDWSQCEWQQGSASQKAYSQAGHQTSGQPCQPHGNHWPAWHS